MTGDTNAKEDIFVRDPATAVTTRVNVASAGTQGTSLSYQPAISDDGRYVAFETASNVVADTDTNGSFDIYVQDRTTGALALQSFDFMGNAAGVSIEAAISSDGQYISYESSSSFIVPAGDNNGRYDIFVHNRVAGGATRVSISTAGAESVGDSLDSSISSDGRYVAFVSTAPGLVAGDNNGQPRRHRRPHRPRLRPRHRGRRRHRRRGRLHPQDHLTRPRHREPTGLVPPPTVRRN